MREWKWLFLFWDTLCACLKAKEGHLLLQVETAVLMDKGNSVGIQDHFDGLVQERHNSSAWALELCLSFTNPSIYAISKDIPEGHGHFKFYLKFSCHQNVVLTVTPKYSKRTRSTMGLLIPWCLVLPRPQQPYNWLCRVYKSLSSTSKCLT